MELEEAKKIHSIVMKMAFAVEGIGECTQEDFDEYKKLSLYQACEANSLMNGHTEPSENGGETFFVTADESALADLYLRIHSSDHLDCDELNSAVEAIDDVGDSDFRVVITGWGYSLEKEYEEVFCSRNAREVKNEIGRLLADYE